MVTGEIHSAHPIPAPYELLRERLERNRDRRQQQVDRLTSVGPGSALDVVAQTHRASVERILSETEAALRRMKNGTFGRCQSCGVEIPLQRLESVPHASCCVGCAQQWVRGR